MITLLEYDLRMEISYIQSKPRMTLTSHFYFPYLIFKHQKPLLFSILGYINEREAYQDRWVGSLQKTVIPGQCDGPAESSV
jgi:hypothetical protein